MSTYEFLLPDIGEGLHQAEIVTWFVSIGDHVKENENILEVQTDKAVVEITAPVSGKVDYLGGKEGETVEVGEVLVRFVETVPQKNVVTEKRSASIEENSKEQAQATSKQSRTRVLAAPSVRKAARNADVNLADVTPTGSKGKILAIDLKNFIEQRNEQVVVRKESEQYSPVTSLKEQQTEKIQGVRKVIFNNMNKSVSHAVHCTGMDKANVSKLVNTRNELLPYAEKLDVKLTYLPFIIKAVSIMLKKHPLFNATVNEEEMLIIYNEQINIGIAMATEQGLIVPVIKNADTKSIIEIAVELSDLSNRAKERKLTTAEMTGSTFTVSNTGSRGGWFATPIINYPEVAIMGIHKIEKEPVIIDDQIQIGHMMGMSLTFDHRIIDGEPSGIFMSGVADLLQNPNTLLLELR